MLADYGTTGLTTRAHPMTLLRDRLPADAVRSRDLEILPHGRRVRVGGLVVARQRPGTANGIVFVLLEDELGTINLIVPARLYESHRLIVRTEPLMLAEGKLERLPAAGGAISVLVERVGQVAAPDRVVAEIAELTPPEDFRAVAPPVVSFASGRRR
jgi:error-prone DNA polymerase